MTDTAPTKPTRRRQADRSRETRRKLFDATVELLIERGYAGTSTQDVAKRAGVSRGAMLHHFPTRADLMSATLANLYQTELDGILEDLGSLPQFDPVGTLWGLYRRPEAKAVVELWLAARNDADFAAAVAPEMERMHEIYRGLWEPIARLLCPFGSEAEIKAYKTRFDLVLATLLGMAMEKALVPSAGLVEDEQGVLDLLRELLGAPG